MGILVEDYRTDFRQLLTDKTHPIAKGLSCSVTLQSRLLGSFLHGGSNCRLERRSFSNMKDWDYLVSPFYCLLLRSLYCGTFEPFILYKALLTEAPKEGQAGDVVG